MKNFLTDRLARRTENEDGFSFLEMVIAGVLLGALAAGGVVGYGKVIENTKKNVVKAAASTVYDAAAVYEYDGDDSTTACSAIDEFNETSNGVYVELIVPDPTAPEDRTKDRVYYGPHYKGDHPADTYTCA